MANSSEVRAHIIINGGSGQLESWFAIRKPYPDPELLAGVALGGIQAATGNYGTTISPVELTGKSSYYCYSIEPPISRATAQDVVNSLGNYSKYIDVHAFDASQTPAQTDKLVEKER